VTAFRVLAWFVTGLGLFGCSKDEERIGASIAVEKMARQEGGKPCFETCAESAEVPLTDARDRCTVSEPDVRAGCGFAGGQDEIRVWLSYDIEIASTTTLDAPALRIVANDGEVDPKASFVAVPRADSSKPVLQVARFFSPNLLAESAIFKVTIPNGVSVATDATYSFAAAQPTIAVEVLLRDVEPPCFAACNGGATVSATLGLRCDTDPRDCSFVAGKDEIRVSVTSGIEAAAAAQGAVPKLDLVGDDKVLDPKVEFIRSPQSSGSGRYDVVLTARMFAPLATLDALAFRASWPDDVVVATDSSFRVSTEEPALVLGECPDDGTCNLPSGLGSVAAIASFPQGFAGQVASFSSRVSGRGADPAAAKTATLTLDDAGLASGEVEMDVPAGIGHKWTVQATAQGLTASKSVNLLEPADALLGIDAGDREATPGEVRIPPRAGRAPRVECRTYSLAVRVPDRPDSEQVTLSAGVGTFNGAQGEATLNLDGRNDASATWVLPADDDSPSVLLELAVDAQRKRQLVVPREPVLPLGNGGTLAAQKPAFEVGVTGTPDDVALRGTLAVVPNAVFGFGSSLLVRTRVVSAEQNDLACGAPIAPSLVKCDPTAATPQERGGCFLTPFSVALNPDGTYSIPVAGGLCFEGALEITTLSKVYTEIDRNKCLGDLEQSTSVVPVGSATLKFERAD
jgi:hypothetical protein